ncbi:MAG TPA: TonB-dependent receptor [Candidatus Acidoferrales bacterium]|nr:TonB-dependent receptor [Candidatus Acidoferrales bacterium]
MRFKSHFFLAISAVLSIAATGYGQSVRGTILGTVTDTSGAVIPGAKITARQTATGLTRTEVSNADGEFSIPQLPVGQYALIVEQANFKKSERTGIELRVDDKLRVDVVLAVGQVTETVAVEATAPVIQTDSATVGNVVDNKKVTELPLNGRSFLQLGLLVPGANQGVKGSQNQTQGGSITVNGAREQANNFLLDGMDNNDLAINQYAVLISTEAMQEFKVQASTYSAEFGRSPGAQVNIATKAGTNAIHGVLYEYFRNNDLDAKNFFDRPGPIPGYKRNQYGTSVGGPIKKNKTFYFGNFEGARVRQGITKVATEPTAAMKNGDFSALSTLIYDPASLHTVNGVLVRDPFAGNIIPAGQLTTVGKNVVGLFPNPNGPGTSTANGLFTSSPTKTDDFDQFTLRLDHRFNDNNTFFGRYSYSKENRFDTFDSFCAGANNVPGFGCNTLNGGQQVVADYIRLLGANKVNEARMSFTRVRGGIFQQNLGNDVSSQLGIAGTGRSSLDFGVPVITTTGYDRLGEATNLPQDRHDNTYEWAESLSWTTGRHTTKFGAEIRHFQENFLFDSSARGTLNFTPFYTAQVSTTAAGVVNAVTGTGNAIADLLLGDPNTASVSRSFAGISANTVAGLRQTSVNLFAQDDFRVLPNLTLNLGLRWEYNAPAIDKYNHLATFDPNFPNSTPLPYLRISTPQTQNIYNSSKKEFSPRAGFAYTPFGPKTVIRGGYGIFWDIKILNVILNSNLTAPFLTGFSFNQSTNGVPNFNLANPYGGTGTPAIPSASWVENPFRDGYVQQWGANIQRQVTSSMGLTVGYVGSKGTHLDRAYDYNEPAPTASFTQALRKYPVYASINVRSPGASSVYHSLQLSFEKRFSKGLSFLSAYTFSKSIDDGSLWNGSAVAVTNFHLERGLSTFDTRHRWITSYTYDLPYGQGRPFGSSSSGVVNALLGGWQTNGILSMQSGNPLDPSTGLQLSGTQTGTRPDVTCNANDFPHDPAKWFNTACFNNNFIGRYGTAGRDIIIGPPTHALDFAMLKKFGLGKEERYLQFRSEIFNIFNHPNFDNPSVTVSSSTFGKITSAGVQDARASSRQIQFALRLVF